MGFMFSRERRWIDPTTRPGYKSPFGASKPKETNWLVVAQQLKKRHPEWKQDVDEIRGELEYQDYLRKKK